ncbi:MAG: dihydrolipoyllysine-residue acetyltransferase [Burkholderiales bacterium 35-55-47]|jgi:pyruvate dehydrogenase E2 component (dihydrolipoamide acetyltransferase)|uniref:dihydrolipoyllysine-residue acetyltransferase n=1 Tax=Limnohabitans sp. TaxID=1907725 RepID=UPI000BCFEF2F|nr:dihydrolipoyllysine-residue acetyltransferase [Limnohabitans sp.]OYY19687.1 MAG: dihydrolipoyllysine-residue acetyltransferase [Burkholderiales bacterium 35-55-47]OYZ74703.1 MAG: dihydrolipoyllysine-residue acetyltransferase [Burkholderiales bacterium 24-55-52]OZB01408.1 MAG: dihydrolipoyllysine-residue acetyltransferase [Burkholderiales bacterium 39-55-53]HQR85876.1 dihydrolipoyllysine-residue acetyltransferase [Limnohabitans sp.]HQS26208.1 dihydrolipoyllysine-residue acetyltransferase [Li
MALVEVKVPDIGDFDEVAVIELLVKVGDTVKAEQSLITVESDKASMEIPSSTAGVVKELKVALGDKVKEGSVVLVVEAAGAAAAPVATAHAAAAPVAAAAAPVAAAPVAAAAPSASGPIEIHVPDIGDFKNVAVIEVFVKPGDSIKVEQSLITVESDKASMEIPSSHAGVLKELKVKVGDTVNIGDLLAILEGTVSAAAAPVAAAASAVAVAVPAAVAATTAVASAVAAVAAPSHTPGAPTLGLPHASPSVRKFARELGVPLEELKGSGHKGRITQDDVQTFTKSVMSGSTQTKAQAAKGGASAGGDGAALGLIPWPKVDFAKFGPIERKEMGRIKKISGANLLRNAIMIPAVTNHDDCDITDLEAFRVSTNKENEKSGVKVTMLAFLIKACVAALKKYPEFNSSLDGDALVYKNYWHIGFAADTPNGLMVPVIRDCDKKGVLQISAEMSELAKKARDGKLGPAEMTGATFTISSLGGIGGKYFTPIINAPEVAILGVCKSTMEPVWNGKEFVPRLMLPLSLTWDHRVIDGAAAARFNAYLGQILGDFRRVLL